VTNFRYLRGYAACVGVTALACMLAPASAGGDGEGSDAADGVIEIRTKHEESALGVVQGLDFRGAWRVLSRACGECHGDSDGEGGFSLEPIADEGSLAHGYGEWMRLRQRLADGSMPPDYAEPLALDERLEAVEWLDAAAAAAWRRRGESAGPAMFRRMAEHEYSNTLRDLLATHFDAGHALPQDVAGGEGFNNAAETLTISPIHAEKYLDAATDALAYAASDADSRGLLIEHRPSEQTMQSEAARANLLALANRAFRRPVDAAEIEPYVRLFDEAAADGLNFEDAVFYAMRGVLTSPQFLFLVEKAPTSGGQEPLTDWELATRLSYFLWASMPDRPLREAADAGRLSDPAELRNQALRMLSEGTHLNDSLVYFVGQWLGTADLGDAKDVDHERHPWIQDHHLSALRNQPVYALESLLRENGSLLELIDADWAFLNNELIGLYKIDRKKLGDVKIAQHLVRVKLPDEYRRHGGLLGSGAALAVSSYPRRTSPVLRGVWVLDKMLGVKLPPPPPNVPVLDESKEALEHETMRERLEAHRADPACATCHNRIDPIGFALENFDELGRWRDRDEGGEIDAVAELPGGKRVEGLPGLKHYLMENKDQFARQLTEKMLGYALARGLRATDQATVETIVEQLHANDYKAQELVLGIVMSKPFRFKGERP
jgi:hypothetical protein